MVYGSIKHEDTCLTGSQWMGVIDPITEQDKSVDEKQRI